MCLDNLTVSRELSRRMEEDKQQVVKLQEEMQRMEGRVEEKMGEMGEMEGR